MGNTIFLSENLKGRNGRPRYRWEDNIQVDLKAVILDDAHWNHLFVKRSSYEYGSDHLGSIKGRNSIG